jgi:hypothetical protein
MELAPDLQGNHQAEDGKCAVFFQYPGHGQDSVSTEGNKVNYILTKMYATIDFETLSHIYIKQIIYIFVT